MTAQELNARTHVPVAPGVQADAFRRLAASWGLRADDLGRIFVHGGDRYAVIGGLPRCLKYKLLCQRLHDGHLYKMAVAAVHFPEAPPARPPRAAAAIRAELTELDLDMAKDEGLPPFAVAAREQGYSKRRLALLAELRDAVTA